MRGSTQQENQDSPPRALGIDIGGTKCAVTLGCLLDGGSSNERLDIEWKASLTTADFTGPTACLEGLAGLIDRALEDKGLSIQAIGSIGISCGGPLDCKKGLILSPPNLPGWDEVPVSGFFKERFGIEALLQNDANACALAEWRYGAGRGLSDLVFLTFGTGLGAGIIAGGHLIEGRSSMAGEVGHIRLADFGPVGYGKSGSFEGFCSGGGIAQLARSLALEGIPAGKPWAFCPSTDNLAGIDAKSVAVAARAGDEGAKSVFAVSGRFLGKGLSVLVDILNPEAIIIGGIFMRCADLLFPSMEMAMSAECLGLSRKACVVLSAGLGEEVGDYAALAVAFDHTGKEL
jgi:glucokinase